MVRMHDSSHETVVGRRVMQEEQVVVDDIPGVCLPEDEVVGRMAALEKQVVVGKDECKVVTEMGEEVPSAMVEIILDLEVAYL